MVTVYGIRERPKGINLIINDFDRKGKVVLIQIRDLNNFNVQVVKYAFLSQVLFSKGCFIDQVLARFNKIAASHKKTLLILRR